MSSSCQENRPLLDRKQVKSALSDPKQLISLFAGKPLGSGVCYSECFYQLGNAAHQLASLERASYRVVADQRAVVIEFESNEPSADKDAVQQLSRDEYSKGFQAILAACGNDWRAVFLAHDSFFQQSVLATAIGWGNANAAHAILDLLQAHPEQVRRAMLNAQPHVPSNADAYRVSSTVLMLAIQRNELELCQRLLEFDEIDVNLADEYGLTALHWAAIMLNGPVIEKLLAKGADQHKQAKPHIPPRLIERLRTTRRRQRAALQQETIAHFKEAQQRFGNHSPAAYLYNMIFQAHNRTTLTYFSQTSVLNILVSHQFYPLWAHYWSQAEPLLILLKQNRDIFGKQYHGLYKELFHQGKADCQQSLAQPLELPDFTPVSDIGLLEVGGQIHQSCP